MDINPPIIEIPIQFSHRRAENKDYRPVISLIHDTLREYELTPEPDGVDHDLNNIEDHYKDGYFGVVERENKIVATFALYPLNDNIVEIRKMYAAPEVRGMGIGRWMVTYLLQLAKHNSYKYVELETASSLIEAIGLYESIGFVEQDFENKTPRCDRSYLLSL